MAIFNLNAYTSADGLGFPLNFRRGNPNPLDNSSVWASFAAAQNYASNDPTAYVGQVLTVVDADSGTATVYVIQDEAGTLKKVIDEAAVGSLTDGYLGQADKDELEAAISAAATKAKEDAILAIMGEAGIDERYDTLKEIADWILSDSTGSADLVTRLEAIESDHLSATDKQDILSAIDEKIGGLTATDIGGLDSWIEEKRNDVAGLLSETDANKLTGIEVGAQVNVLEGISIDGVAVDVTDKIAAIPLATAEKAGAMSAVDKQLLSGLGDRMDAVEDAVALIESAIAWEDM